MHSFLPYSSLQHGYQATSCTFEYLQLTGKNISRVIQVYQQDRCTICLAFNGHSDMRCDFLPIPGVYIHRKSFQGGSQRFRGRGYWLPSNLTGCAPTQSADWVLM